MEEHGSETLPDDPLAAFAGVGELDDDAEAGHYRAALSRLKLRLNETLTTPMRLRLFRLQAAQNSKATAQSPLHSARRRSTRSVADEPDWLETTGRSSVRDGKGASVLARTGAIGTFGSTERDVFGHLPRIDNSRAPFSSTIPFASAPPSTCRVRMRRRSAPPAVTDQIRQERLHGDIKTGLTGRRLGDLDTGLFLRSIQPLLSSRSSGGQHQPPLDPRRVHIAEVTPGGDTAQGVVEFGAPGRLPYRNSMLSHHPLSQPPTRHPALPHLQNFDRHKFDLGPGSYTLPSTIGQGQGSTVASFYPDNRPARRRAETLHRAKRRTRVQQAESPSETPGPASYYPPAPSPPKPSVSMYHASPRPPLYTGSGSGDEVPGPGAYVIHPARPEAGFGQASAAALAVPSRGPSFGSQLPRFAPVPGAPPRLQPGGAVVDHGAVTSTPGGLVVYVGRPDTRYASREGGGKDMDSQLDAQHRRRLRGDLEAQQDQREKEPPKDFIAANKALLERQSPERREADREEAKAKRRRHMAIVKATAHAILLEKRARRLARIMAEEQALGERLRKQKLHWPGVFVLVSSFLHFGLRIRQRRAVLLLNARRERAAAAVQAYWRAYKKRQAQARVARALLVLGKAFNVWIFQRRLKKKQAAAALLRRFLADTLQQCQHRIAVYRKRLRRRMRREQLGQQPLYPVAIPPFLQKVVGPGTSGLSLSAGPDDATPQPELAPEAEPDPEGLAEASKPAVSPDASLAASRSVSWQRSPWYEQDDEAEDQELHLSRGGTGLRQPRTVIGVVQQFKDHIVRLQRAFRHWRAQRDAHVQLLLLLWDKVVAEQRQLVADQEAQHGGGPDSRSRRRSRASRASASPGRRASSTHSPPSRPAVSRSEPLLDALTLSRIDKRFLLSEKRRILLDYARRKRIQYLDAVRRHQLALRKWVQRYQLGFVAGAGGSLSRGGQVRRPTRAEAEAEFVALHPPPVFRHLPPKAEMIALIKSAIKGEMKKRP